MKRLGVGLMCFAALCLLSGCASFRDSYARIARNMLVTLHLAKAQQPEPKPAAVCLLDPLAYAPEAPQSEAASESAPVAEVPETTHDFGEMHEDRDFVHKFSVRNTGRSVLNIKKVVPG